MEGRQHASLSRRRAARLLLLLPALAACAGGLLALVRLPPASRPPLAPTPGTGVAASAGRRVAFEPPPPCRGLVRFDGPPRDPVTGRKVVYLTFDDGPSPYLGSILATLERAGVRATFFFVGSRLPDRAGLVRAALAAGHAVGNHSWDHALLVRLGPADQQMEIARSSRAFLEVLGFAPRAFRPPYGSYDAATCEAVRSFGMEIVLWDEDPQDWSLRSGQEALLVRRVEADLFPGAVVDLHESALTARALPELLARLRALGYEVRPLPTGTAALPEG
ncbi:MAG: polysaccharide deacetylase family protein [Bacillota bacterium]|nr:polysaccharide deacetylase family protein [Bacillota bacterium]